MFAANLIMQAMAVTAFMAVIFLVKIKQARMRRNSLKKREKLNEIAVVFGKYDNQKDIGMIMLTVVAILSLSVIDGKVDSLTVLYVILNIFVLGLWHMVLFRQRTNGEQKFFATYSQLINDSLITFAIPVIMMCLTIFKEGFNTLRLYQALLVFIVLYIRHWILFGGGNKN